MYQTYSQREVGETVSGDLTMSMNVIGCRGGGIGLIEDLWKPREAALWHRIFKAKMRPPSRIPCILMKEGKEELEKSKEGRGKRRSRPSTSLPRSRVCLLLVWGHFPGGYSDIAAPILEY